MLVVGDDDDTRELLEAALRRRGYHVKSVSSAGAALALLAAAACPPSIIVLDLDERFLAERDRRPDLEEIPIVVMAPAADACAPLRNGVSVVKPVTPTALLLSIDLLV